MLGETHLAVRELTLLPSGEWLPKPEAWWVARVAAGAGYWIQPAGSRQLAAGDMLVLAPRTEGTLRASSLGLLCIQFFVAQPRLLSGLLPVPAWEKLERESDAGREPVFFQAHEPLAQQFTQLVAQQPRSNFALRCRLLQLWADSISGLLIEAGGTEHDLRNRFRRLLNELSEAELAACSVRELAERLHCSERHFSRLFHEEFHVAFRARQTEIRLQRAGQLLAESNAKIINVAYESGYRHLGLFNTMFKRRFGMTPTQWREHSRKPPSHRLQRSLGRTCVFFLALLLHVCLSASAQTNSPAQAGTANATNSAAPPKPQGFEVRRYDVRGNTLLSKPVVDAIFAEATGKEVTLEQIRKAVARLLTTYREHGYASVVATLPPQQLTNAIVIVQVTEAPLRAVTIVNNRFFSSNNIMRVLPSLQDVGVYTNVIMNSQVLQGELDAANANRDRQIYPVIGPGPDPGTSELTLKVKDRLPLHGRLELNNAYTPGTPTLRLNANASYNNLWQLEHQLGMQYTFTPQDTKQTSVYDTTPFDDPQVATYSAYYRLPLGDVTGLEEEINANPLNFGYSEVTHQFTLPPTPGRSEMNFYASRSTSDTGVKFTPQKLVFQSPLETVYSSDSGQDVTLNENLGGRLSVPLPSTSRLRGSLAFGLDFKRYRLSSFNTNNFYITTTITNAFGKTNITQTVSSPQPTRSDGVDYLPFNAGGQVSVLDTLGTTFFNAGVNFNVLHPGASDQGNLLSGNDDFGHAAYTTNAHASYVTINAGCTRDQTIYHEWGVLLRANGQWANEPLISNEQFAMGGQAGVRGYLDGEAYGDSGWRLQFEPHTPLINLGLVDATAPFWVRASIFMDYGQLFSQAAPGVKPREDFWGTGFGVTGTIGDHFDARFGMAWALLKGLESQKGDYRFYFAIAAQF
jgi:hemolysin activation/secretion protein/AraC-like DNA-binding protein